MTSGGSSRPRRNSSTSSAGRRREVAPSPPSTRTSRAQRSPSSRRGRRGDDRPEPVTGEDDRAAPSVEQPGALRDRDDVVGRGRRGRRRRLGRRVGQAVPAEVHRDASAGPAIRRRATGAQTQALADEPVDERRRPALAAPPPQSRKWIRSPGSTTTTKPGGSPAGSGGAALGHAARIGRHAEAPSRRPDRRSPRAAPATARSSGSSSARWPASRAVPRARSTRSRSSSTTSRRPSSGARTTSPTTRRCTACTRACRGPSTAPTGSAVPNRITLFRLPLEEDFPDPDDLADEVRITVIHELAHHLGHRRRPARRARRLSGCRRSAAPGSGASRRKELAETPDVHVAAGQRRRRRARRRRIGMRPARTAASAAAPAGSRTCFIRSTAKRMPARIVAIVEQDDLVEVAPGTSPASSSPGERRAEPVGDASAAGSDELAGLERQASSRSRRSARRRRPGSPGAAP